MTPGTVTDYDPHAVRYLLRYLSSPESTKIIGYGSFTQVHYPYYRLRSISIATPAFMALEGLLGAVKVRGATLVGAHMIIRSRASVKTILQVPFEILGVFVPAIRGVRTPC